MQPWGEGGLGLVEEVEAVGVEAVAHEVYEGFAVGAFVGGGAAEDCQLVWAEGLGFGGYVVVGLGAEEEAGAGFFGVPAQDHVVAQWGLGGAGGEAVVLAAAFGVHAQGYGHCFDQGRFAAAVLAHQECHAGGERQATGFHQVFHHGEVEGVAVLVGAAIEAQGAEVGATGLSAGHDRVRVRHGHLIRKSPTNRTLRHRFRLVRLPGRVGTGHGS